VAPISNRRRPAFTPSVLINVLSKKRPTTGKAPDEPEKKPADDKEITHDLQGGNLWTTAQKPDDSGLFPGIQGYFHDAKKIAPGVTGGDF
jgi:hypothetical protein